MGHTGMLEQRFIKGVKKNDRGTDKKYINWNRRKSCIMWLHWNIETIAYSAVEKLDAIKDKYNKYIPKDSLEWWNKNSINLENLIWAMQELSIQANKGLLDIVAKM